MTADQEMLRRRLPQQQQHGASQNNVVIQRLQCNASLRSVTYLTGAAFLLHAAARLYDPESDWAPYATAITTAPLGYAWTYAFVMLRKEDKLNWNRVPLRQGITYAGVGAVLGTSAFLVTVGIAAAQGWVRLPEWGWERTPYTAVARSLLRLAIGNIAVAWNEEMVFRGYGLHTATLAIGRPAAALGLTLLDGWAHGPGLRTFIGQGSVALTLLLFRLQSGSLWMPVGYHFAWNYMQTGIFGPLDKMPSLRPLHVTGPAAWIGRPGSPEPGFLSTLVHVGIATMAVWAWWRRRSTTKI